MKSFRNLARGWLWMVYLFLYFPIAVLIIFSFNDSRQDMLWRGFSLRWYGALLVDSELISGLWLSLKIAVLTACSSVLLGLFAAFTLQHYPKFYGRTLFRGMLSSPLVMPEVIIGLSLLLLFVSLEKNFGFAQRGLITIWVGHTVIGVAYASVVISSRLQEIPRAWAEAAMDLGSRPFQVFMLITLPNIRQAMLSAWLLTFTLSLDDVVLSAFLSGPGYSTMPIVIFSRARLGLDPRVNAIATITILIVSLALLIASVYIMRRERLQHQQTPVA